MFSSNQYKRMRQINVAPATVNKTALEIAFKPKLAYDYACKFLELTERLKVAGIQSKADIQDTIAIRAILAEMGIPDLKELEAYRNRV